MWGVTTAADVPIRRIHPRAWYRAKIDLPHPRQPGQLMWLTAARQLCGCGSGVAARRGPETPNSPRHWHS